MALMLYVSAILMAPFLVDGVDFDGVQIRIGDWHESCIIGIIVV